MAPQIMKAQGLQLHQYQQSSNKLQNKELEILIENSETDKEDEIIDIKK